jgi:hypothetical protein
VCLRLAVGMLRMLRMLIIWKCNKVYGHV